MNEIGNMLRVTRESSGVSIEEASHDLNIKDVILENIEDGKIGSFKDVFQLKSYINDYAKYLGLDGEKLVDSFNEYLFEYTSKIPVKEIEKAKANLELLAKDKTAFEESKKATGEEFAGITLGATTYMEKETAGKKLLEAIKSVDANDVKDIGSYRGFKMQVFYDAVFKQYRMNISNNYHYQIELGSDEYGNLTRLENAFDKIDKEINKNTIDVETLTEQFENAKIEAKADFKYETELKEKQIRLNEVNAILNISDKDRNVVDFDDSQEDIDERDRDDDFDR